MEPFATTQDMEDRTQGEITTTSHPFLEQELAAASRTIRNHCGWHVATVEAVTYRHRSRFTQEVWLPVSKVWSIDSATIDGIAIDASTIEFDEDTGWTNLYGRLVEVQFQAGYPEIPEDLVVLTLELAAGGLGAPLNIIKEQAGGVSVTLSRASSMLVPGDHGRLAEYKLGRLP